MSLDPDEDDPPDKPPAERSKLEQIGYRLGQALGGVLLLGCVAVVVVIAIKLIPDKLPQRTNPNFIDNIFASRIVIWAARATLLVGAAYVVVSIIGNVQRGRLLERLGPAQVGNAVKTVEAQLDATRQQLDEQLEINHQLEDRLRERDKQIQGIYAAHEQLRRKLEPPS